MKHRDFPQSITIVKEELVESDQKIDTGEASSLSSRRTPQDFYFDIVVTPRPEQQIVSGAQSKKIRNRIRAFELASRTLRDVPDVEYDQTLNAHSSLRARPSYYEEQFFHPRTKNTTNSDHLRGRTSLPESIDFGNHSDSRVLQMRRDEVRREIMVSSCDHPSRGDWGDLTYHNSARNVRFPVRPKNEHL